MPRYFFHRADGVFDPDQEGTEFPDLATARIEAIRFAAASMLDDPQEVRTGHNFRVELSDEHGMLLCTVVVLSLDTPAARELREPRRADIGEG